VKVIFDTDMAADVDDVGALAILHAMADLGEAEILAVGISSRNEDVGPVVDAINTWYGRPDIPIGYQRGIQVGYPADTGEAITSKYAEAVRRSFPHRLARSSDAPDAALLYRKVLAAQPDASVVIVSVGFLTNLRSLLDTPPDAISSAAARSSSVARSASGCAWAGSSGRAVQGRRRRIQPARRHPGRRAAR
jgi:inosine-uridine nucleoside N-ribohydrolase